MHVQLYIVNVQCSYILHAERTFTMEVRLVLGEEENEVELSSHK